MKDPVTKRRTHAAASAEDVVYELRLYVAGQTPKSVTAVANLERICARHLAGRYRIEVINLTKMPHLAARDQIVAVPTLLRKSPVPVRRIIGDLSDTERVLAGLDLQRHASNPASDES